jgi:peptide/nickel transport system substrate-binding protein
MLFSLDATMKGAIRRLGGAVLALGLALGCAKAPPAPVKDTLVRHLDGDPSTLDPLTINDELGLRVVDLLFRPLVGIDRERRFVPGLAASWQVSDDGRTYTFSLDPKARWEDGSPVTSADVKFTLERILDPKAGAVNWRPALEDLQRVETPDAATARVIFKKPYAERLLALNLPIVSAAAYERDPKAVHRSPVGSGPYRLESWETNQKLVLVRRVDSASAAHFDRVVFRPIPDDAVRYQAGSRGELDEFRVIRTQTATAQKAPEFLAKYRLIKSPQFLVVQIVWNCRNPLLADARVRRALAMAWPRAETAKQLYPPDGAALVSGPYPAGVAENDPNTKPPAFDIAAAGKLLDEAGLPAGPDGARRKSGKKVSLELLFVAGPRVYANLAEILRQAYGKVGIELALRPLDWAACVNRGQAGEFDAQIMAQGYLPPNLDMYPYFHSSQAPPGGGNQGRYANAEADRVMEAAQSELDAAKRLELYRQVHRLLAADPPADFLWTADQYWAISKNVEGVETSAIGLFHFLPGPLGWRPAAAR